jgi:hypothetical protein
MRRHTRCPDSRHHPARDINGPITAPGSKPSATFIAPAVSARPRKGVVKAVVHPNLVGTDTLARASMLRLFQRWFEFLCQVAIAYPAVG